MGHQDGGGVAGRGARAAVRAQRRARVLVVSFCLFTCVIVLSVRICVRVSNVAKIYKKAQNIGALPQLFKMEIMVEIGWSLDG